MRTAVVIVVALLACSAPQGAERRLSPDALVVRDAAELGQFLPERPDLEREEGRWLWRATPAEFTTISKVR